MALPLTFVWMHQAYPETDAVVTVKQHSLFRPKSGTLQLSGSNPCRITVMAPNWNSRTTELEAFLYTTYRKILETAKNRGCKTVLMPLLSANASFPRSLDDQIANQVLMPFAAKNNMEVYLLRDQADPALAASHHGELEQYMEKAAREVLKDLRREARKIQADEFRIHEDICAPAPAAPASLYHDELELFLGSSSRQEEESFLENLFRRIEDSGMTDPAVYSGANISRQVFSKMQNKYLHRQPYTPQKATAVALAIALKLDLKETEDLIGRAGYSLSRESTFDLIIRFFIEKNHYNIKDINLELVHHDQPQLGSLGS